MTALGARRGLSGLIWGLCGLTVCLVAGALGVGMWPSVGLAFVLGVAATFAISRLILDPLDSPVFVFLGAIGGLLFGTLMISALALGFPLGLQTTPNGVQLAYPSTSMHPALYNAINNSAIKNNLNKVWQGSPTLKALIIPDRVKKN